MRPFAAFLLLPLLGNLCLTSTLGDRECSLGWTEGQVVAWLKSQGFGSYASAFKGHRVDGDALTALNDQALKDIGIT